MSLCGDVDAAGIRMPLHRFAGTIRRNKHRDDRAHGRLQNPLAQNDVRAGEPSRRWEARWNKWKGHLSRVRASSTVVRLSDDMLRPSFGCSHWLSLPFIPSIAETLEFCITTGYPFRHA